MGSHFLNAALSRLRGMEPRLTAPGSLMLLLLLGLLLLLQPLSALGSVTSSQRGSSFSMQEHRTEHCQFESFNASCSHGNAVLMTSAQYGRRRLGRCARQDLGIGCVADVLAYADWRCSGRRQCRWNVADLGLDGVNPCLGDFSSYLETTYVCVPVDAEACTGLQRRPLSLHPQRLGYISSVYDSRPPSHPDDVISPSASRDTSSAVRQGTMPRLPCAYLLHAEPGQRINVTLLYFHPAPGGSSADVGHAHNESPLVSGGEGDVSRGGACRRLAIIRDRLSGKEATVCAEEGVASAKGWVKDAVVEGIRGGEMQMGQSERLRDVFLSDNHVVELVVLGIRQGETARRVDSSDQRFMLRYQVVGCATPSYVGMHVIVTSEKRADVVCNSTKERWTLSCALESGEWAGHIGDCPPLADGHAHPGGDGDENSDSMWSTLNHEWKSSRGLSLVVGLGILLGVIIGLLLLAVATFLIRGHYICTPLSTGSGVLATYAAPHLELVQDPNQDPGGLWQKPSANAASEYGTHARPQHPPAPQQQQQQHQHKLNDDTYYSDIWRLHERLRRSRGHSTDGASSTMTTTATGSGIGLHSLDGCADSSENAPGVECGVHQRQRRTAAAAYGTTEGRGGAAAVTLLDDCGAHVTREMTSGFRKGGGGFGWTPRSQYHVCSAAEGSEL